MDDHYCPMCGEHHGGLQAEAEAETIVAEEVTAAEVRIAEINAEKEIRLAKIAAGMMDVEREAELAHAEGKAEGMEAVMEAAAPEPEPEPEPESIPIPVPEPEPEPEAPPVVEEHHDRTPKQPKGFFG